MENEPLPEKEKKFFAKEAPIGDFKKVYETENFVSYQDEFGNRILVNKKSIAKINFL